MFIEQCFFLVSSFLPLMAFVLKSVALPEFCAEFECFSQDLTDVIDSVANSTTSSLYLPALCIMVLRD